MEIKIAKKATHKSILDIRSGLNYYKRKGEEEQYKGSIKFLINEYGHSKVQLMGFLPKATAKMVFDLIKNHHFQTVFPNGFTRFSGTPQSGKGRAFKISFNPQNMKYIVTLEEGKGQLMKTGGMKMMKKEKSVMTYVALQDMLEISHEVIDFIHSAEMVAMKKGKPLHTIIHDDQQQHSQQNQQQGQQTQDYNNHQNMNNFPQQYGGYRVVQ